MVRCQLVLGKITRLDVRAHAFCINNFAVPKEFKVVHIEVIFNL